MVDLAVTWCGSDHLRRAAALDHRCAALSSAGGDLSDPGDEPATRRPDQDFERPAALRPFPDRALSGRRLTRRRCAPDLGRRVYLAATGRSRRRASSTPPTDVLVVGLPAKDLDIARFRLGRPADDSAVVHFVIDGQHLQRLPFQSDRLLLGNEPPALGGLCQDPTSSHNERGRRPHIPLIRKDFFPRRAMSQH